MIWRPVTTENYVGLQNNFQALKSGEIS